MSTDGLSQAQKALASAAQQVELELQRSLAETRAEAARSFAPPQPLLRVLTSVRFIFRWEAEALRHQQDTQAMAERSTHPNS